jgi:hypothetical protein
VPRKRRRKRKVHDLHLHLVVDRVAVAAEL